MEYSGLIGSGALLIFLALRGVNIILASLICPLVVILTNPTFATRAFWES